MPFTCYAESCTPAERNCFLGLTTQTGDGPRGLCRLWPAVSFLTCSRRANANLASSWPPGPAHSTMQDEVLALVPASVTSSQQRSLRQRFFFKDAGRAASPGFATGDTVSALSPPTRSHPVSHFRPLGTYPGARVSSQRATRKGQRRDALRRQPSERRSTPFDASRNGTGPAIRPQPYRGLSNDPSRFPVGHATSEERHLGPTQGTRGGVRGIPVDYSRRFSIRGIEELGRETSASEAVERGAAPQALSRLSAFGFSALSSVAYPN